LRGWKGGRTDHRVGLSLCVADGGVWAFGKHLGLAGCGIRGFVCMHAGGVGCGHGLSQEDGGNLASNILYLRIAIGLSWVGNLVTLDAQFELELLDR